MFKHDFTELGLLRCIILFIIEAFEYSNKSICDHYRLPPPLIRSRSPPLHRYRGDYDSQ
jgi:hypothetical protein